MGSSLRRLGIWLFYVGLAAFAGIFIIVMFNGTWPIFLSPVKILFSTLSNYVGGWALIVEGWLFLGPGILLVKFGDALLKKQDRQRK